MTEGLDVYNANMRSEMLSMGGWHVPFPLAMARQMKPRVLGNLTAHLDILPTLCELAGVKIPQESNLQLEGFSLLPLLTSEHANEEWQKERILFHHVARWPSGYAEKHKYTMAGVRKGNHLMLRSYHCGDDGCLQYMSQCQALRIIERGGKNQVYSRGTAQFHWGVSPRDKWVLYDVKNDPGCRKDLSMQKPKLVSDLSLSYEKWWDGMYPQMIEKGGDLGDPDQGKRHQKETKHGKKRKNLPPNKLIIFPTQISKLWGLPLPLVTNFLGSTFEPRTGRKVSASLKRNSLIPPHPCSVTFRICE